jgi:hypothetical protein
VHKAPRGARKGAAWRFSKTHAQTVLTCVGAVRLTGSLSSLESMLWPSRAPQFPADLVHDGFAPHVEQGVSFLKDVGWAYAGSHRQPLLSSQMIFSPSPATPVMP